MYSVTAYVTILSVSKEYSTVCVSNVFIARVQTSAGKHQKHQACITLPVVAAIIGYNILMLALLHCGDLLLNRCDVIS